jgi:hypothetical protein
MKKDRKKKPDLNETAFSIVQKAIGQVDSEDSDTKDDKTPPIKNPSAVALGRLGGLKGGRARAKKLTKEQRSEIARKAAKTRWKK